MLIQPDRKNEKLPIPEPEELTLTEEQLREVTDGELHSRLHRLIEETKRTQRELERRLIFAYEFYNMREHVPNPQLAAATKIAATEKQLEKEQKERQRIREAIATLAASIKTGGVSKEQLISKIKKG